MQQRSNILFLYWPPWSWKSTLWVHISQRLWVPYFDTDTVLEETYGKISDIIEQNWESHFRELETLTLMDIADRIASSWWVVSLWGGTLLRRENIWVINLTRGRIITLIWDWDMLFERIEKDTKNNRPLARRKDQFIELMRNREEHYASFPLRIDIDGKTPSMISDEISRIMGICLIPPTPSPGPRSPWVSARSLVDHSTW